ncbi:hypothetical protein BU25DRAFT_451095 [Macroventuria anomochaeta]|uniref:Uncharacterized protein n=1 Tax=Macroventuria anomochaeta TaxID=301207 RepID=A0ACB6RPL8_9PLEO|nr:uncharacterized protein BU25DRAFT_451095 [Macroventuria anomochaeta]KAF2623900.1 hypothetical protein BU25DRAFT_451095 [Macroventuria anomochaeta]
MDNHCMGLNAQSDDVECPLLKLPGELRNRIYAYTVEESTIPLTYDMEWQPAWTRTCIRRRQFLGLTQVCRQIRFEFLPLYKTHTKVAPNTWDIYKYIDTWVAPGTSDENVLGHVILDFMDDDRGELGILDIKPLLQLARRAEGFHVEIVDVTEPNDCNSPTMRSIEETLADLYDIQDMDMFYEYMDEAMTALVVRASEESGVEIIFELSPQYWEDWMGEWSKPDHDPNYRIPLELEDTVVEWGRQCGMELDRATGSHLTVNYRPGEVDSDESC